MAKRQTFRIPAAEDLTQRDIDILTMAPKDAAKKYKTTPQKISSRKNTLWRHFGTNFIPPQVKGTGTQGTNTTQRKVTPTAAHATVLTEKDKNFPHFKTAVTNGQYDVEINFPTFAVKMRQTPNRIFVDPATNTLELNS